MNGLEKPTKSRETVQKLLRGVSDFQQKIHINFPRRQKHHQTARKKRKKERPNNRKQSWGETERPPSRLITITTTRRTKSKRRTRAPTITGRPFKRQRARRQQHSITNQKPRATSNRGLRSFRSIARIGFFLLAKVRQLFLSPPHLTHLVWSGLVLALACS